MTKPRPDTYASSYIPPSAVQCWVDDTHVYCCVPAVSGPPLIQAYALTEAGLSKALNILRKQRVWAKASAEPKPKPAEPKITRPRSKVVVDDATREAARAIMRKRGII